MKTIPLIEVIINSQNGLSDDFLMFGITPEIAIKTDSINNINNNSIISRKLIVIFSKKPTR